MYSIEFFSPSLSLCAEAELAAQKLAAPKVKAARHGSPIPFYGQLYFPLCRCLLLTHATLQRPWTSGSPSLGVWRGKGMPSGRTTCLGSVGDENKPKDYAIMCNICN
jgi:hypothetical protein